MVTVDKLCTRLLSVVRHIPPCKTAIFKFKSNVLMENVISDYMSENLNCFIPLRVEKFIYFTFECWSIIVRPLERMPVHAPISLLYATGTCTTILPHTFKLCSLLLEMQLMYKNKILINELFPLHLCVQMLFSRVSLNVFRLAS